MAVRIIQRNGHSVRAWFSNEFAGQSINGPNAQEGEVGYLLDTDQDGVYRNGVWIFYKSQRQILHEIRDLLDIPPAAIYDEDNPLITKPLEGLVTVKDPITTVGPLPIPVTVFASAYTAGDAFGNKFQIEVPLEGTISNVVFYDKDDEGLEKELWLFRADFTATADDAEFAISDADLISLVGVISIASFKNAANNQLGQATPALSYKLTAGRFYCQMVTRGADNIAAGQVPSIALTII